MLYSSEGDEGGKGTLGWITALVISRVAIPGPVWPSGLGRGALNSQGLCDLWVYSERFHKISLPRSLQHRLNCGAWREPPSDFCLLAYIAANKQPGCALPCHRLDKLICCFPTCPWCETEKTILAWDPTSLHRNILTASWRLAPWSPSSSTCSAVPFTVTLCSPVPGWVYRSIWMDTSPTGSSTPEPVGRKWTPPHAHMDYWSLAQVFTASGRQCGVFTTHLPEPAFQSAPRMSQ